MQELTEEEENNSTFYEPIDIVYYTLTQLDADKRFSTTVVFNGKVVLQDDCIKKTFKVKKAFCLISKLPIFEVLK